jgi:hypothetical protein
MRHLILKKKITIHSFSEYEDDIYPYATFQAWQPVGQVSSQRGFQTFVYQGSDSPGVNSYAPGEVSDKSTVTLLYLKARPCWMLLLRMSVMHVTKSIEMSVTVNIVYQKCI